jgi:hypothetical protein
VTFTDAVRPPSAIDGSALEPEIGGLRALEGRYNMSGGGGGGSPIFGAYAVIRNRFRAGTSGKLNDERAELDAEELREVEYESMGIAVPEHKATPPARSGVFSRVRQWLLSSGGGTR